MLWEDPTNRPQGISINQARRFPQKFNSWLGGMVRSLNKTSMVLEGQGCQLQVLYSKDGLSMGDKVLIKISNHDFEKWLKDPHHWIREVLDMKRVAPSQNSTTHPLPVHTYRKTRSHLENPLSPHNHYELIERWNRFVHTIRRYFKDNGFMETPTPSLVMCPGVEPNLEPFVTTLSLGKNQTKLFLPTSPELHLKKLLAQGWSEIFEIKSCFRNGELSHHHQPEFTMLEWYRAYNSLNSMAQDIQCLISQLNEEGFVTGSIGNFQNRSISQLFLEYTDLKLTPSTTKEELIRYCHHICQPIDDKSTWDDVFHLIFITQIETHLGKSGPEFIYNFPASQAALAQVNEKGWADRMELYWHGIEIGNAFNELQDPVEQRKRFQKEITLRKQMGRTQVPIDEKFMEALEKGLPPCAGIAVGLERLFLACQDMYEIEKLHLFPFHPQNKEPHT